MYRSSLLQVPAAVCLSSASLSASSLPVKHMPTMEREGWGSRTGSIARSGYTHFKEEEGVKRVDDRRRDGPQWVGWELTKEQTPQSHRDSPGSSPLELGIGIRSILPVISPPPVGLERCGWADRLYVQGRKRERGESLIRELRGMSGMTSGNGMVSMI